MAAFKGAGTDQHLPLGSCANFNAPSVKKWQTAHAYVFTQQGQIRDKEARMSKLAIEQKVLAGFVLALAINSVAGGLAYQAVHGYIENSANCRPRNYC